MRMILSGSPRGPGQWRSEGRARAASKLRPSAGSEGKARGVGREEVEEGREEGHRGAPGMVEGGGKGEEVRAMEEGREEAKGTAVGGMVGGGVRAREEGP